MNYLTEEQLIQINARIIKKFTPQEIIGVREKEGLNAVVEAPKATAFGEDAYPTNFDKAQRCCSALQENNCSKMPTNGQP